MFNEKLISAFQKKETPFYYYDIDLLTKTIAEVKHWARLFDFDIHYAVKANCNREILDTIQSAGFGADCVSGNEVKLAASVGFAPNKILFAGVGKTDKEILSALEIGIQAFNCESLEEIIVLNELAEKRHKVAEISLRINPNVDAKTHKYITTGLEENKFGINQTELPSLVQKLQSLANIKVTGLHFHIGSQITDMKVFQGLCIRVNDIQTWFCDQGMEITHLNLGGGLGIDYYQPDEALIPDFKTYFTIFNDFIDRKIDQKIHFELGRSIVAQCGNLITRVVYVKKGISKQFAIVDAGMTELMRPALYQSYHQIDNLTSSGLASEYDVVGPICESTDCFGKNIELNEVRRGDLIAIRSAGAYGEVMMSNYNLRDRHPAYYLQPSE